MASGRSGRLWRRKSCRQRHTTRCSCQDLPLDMQKREATHIFRPFEGYKARPCLMLCSNCSVTVARHSAR